MARDVRPQFDPTANFYVTRPFKAGGKLFAVDELFDKSLVDTRRLRQIYDLRQLRQVATAKPQKRPLAETMGPVVGPVAEPKPVKRFRRRAAA